MNPPPHYLRLLHANFLHEPATEQAAMSRHLLDAATSIPMQELRRGLQSGNWRDILTAAWLAAIRPEATLRPLLEEKLLASTTCYAGQGLCIAVARFRDAPAADTFRQYLARYLPAGDRIYDQEWAIGALAWLDGLLGSRDAEALAADPALWITTASGRQIGRLDPARGIARVGAVMGFLEGVVG